jgi:hypothetical protein
VQSLNDFVDENPAIAIPITSEATPNTFSSQGNADAVQQLVNGYTLRVVAVASTAVSHLDGDKDIFVNHSDHRLDVTTLTRAAWSSD